MTSGAPYSNRIRDSIKVCGDVGIGLPRVSSNEADDAAYVTRLLRSRSVNNDTAPSTSAHLLRLTSYAILHNSLPRNKITEDGLYNPNNPQLGRFNGTVSAHPGLPEHQRINRDTMKPENIPVTRSQEGVRAQEAIIECINKHAVALECCEDDPLVRMQVYGANCQSYVGIGGHFDSCPPQVQMSRYPSSKSPVVIVRSVLTEVPTGVSSNVIFRTYQGGRTGSGVTKIGDKDVPYKVYTRYNAARPVSGLTTPKKSGGGSTYSGHPSVNGFLPQALYNEDESALMTTHEVTIQNRHRGIIVTLLIDYPFSSVAKAEAAMAIMKRNP